MSAHCRKNPPGYHRWTELLREEPSIRWTRRGETRRPWTLEERERAIEALGEVPAEVSAASVRAIYRMKISSLYSENPASGEAGEMVLYDAAFRPNVNLARVLAHEFAHEVYRQMPDDERDSYRRAANWLLISNPRAPLGRQLVPNREESEYVEIDGTESLTEDFSNNVEYFIFEPETLRRKTPKVSEWLRKRFGDRLNMKRAVVP